MPNLRLATRNAGDHASTYTPLPLPALHPPPLTRSNTGRQGSVGTAGLIYSRRHLSALRSDVKLKVSDHYSVTVRNAD
ncbi:hypothetical protein INR49_000433 [Caranx melampygus]|nr:hypothetical protein INR49_000433 [Caranx melampygus]